ncbi:MAG: methyltransferase domain-containing protein [Gluconacetobacter diazotrophicus]|nr:methyltransferase domain-containing protein [Gluconacetobacter diazotrophicus]
MTAPASWDASVFDRLYAADPDPWRFETSPYERAKYDATLALLPADRRYRSALELGCSIGVFTRRLAPRCDALLAVDLAAAALLRAHDGCASLPQVRFERRVLPADFPPGRFDLVLASELLYFLDATDLDTLSDRMTAALAPGGLLLLANWTGPTDTPHTGDAAADHVLRRVAPVLRPVASSRHDGFRLDLLADTGGI